MKFIVLPKGKLAKVDDEDFDRLNQFKWICHHGYVVTGKFGIPMHRLILRTNQRIDHGNLNKLDNRKQNLRFATHQQNCFNRPKRKDSNQKYKCVHYRKDRNAWVVSIGHNGKRQFIGYFKNELAAHMAYRIAARRLHGEFARLN